MKKLLLTSMTLMVLVSIGCSKRETPVEVGNREGVLHRGIGSEPRDLDPHTVTGVTEFNVITSLIEGLVAPDHEDLHPVGGVAKSWKVSWSGKKYTFTLRDDAKWSNGDPVTAHDFVFSYKRMLSPALGSAYSYMLFTLKNGEAYYNGKIDDFNKVGVEARDDQTLVLTLQTPTPYFLSLLNHHSWFPVHPATILAHGKIDERGTKWTRPGNYIGNGPFILKTWEPDKKIVVEKSTTYWDRDSVRLNQVHFYPIGDHNVEERSFRAGQLHVTETLPIHRIKHYMDSESKVLRADPYLGTYYYLLNVKRPPLNDSRVRQALALSIDREKLVKFVTKGGEEPALFFTPPDTAGYTSKARLEPDVEKAKKLLADAGYPDGKGFPSLQLLYNTSDAHLLIAQAIHQMWKTNLGIDVEMINMEWKVYLATTQEKKFDIARAGWIGDYIDPNTFLDMWITGRGNNRTGWSNVEYDALLDKAANTMNKKKRYKYFQKAEKILMDEMPVIPIYFYRSKKLVQTSVKGWNPTILDIHPYKHLHLEE